MKISIIGAGNVGSALAERILREDLADVVLIDVVEGLAKAKAFDLSDASSIVGYKKTIIGTESYEEINGSNAIVITAGLPRRPGMSREGLVGKNSMIVKSVVKRIKTHATQPTLIVVTNPLDVMTYIAYKEAACPRHKIIGMAGNLDTARFTWLLSQRLNVPFEEVKTCVLGSHGDTMVPIVSKTRIGQKPVTELLTHDEIKDLVEKTKKRGGEIVRLLKSGSAYFSPSAAILELLIAIIRDEKKVIPCSCVVEGEYGLNGCAIGVPAKLGRDGIEEIVEWELTDDESSALKNSARVVKGILQDIL